ncbi:dipeptidase [Reticulibacter mediterranei]|uniref:Dipeptidase n=1 Tax=Reticulibacter mediterranei TaxID=2778369 RepID=A0A8J3J0I0_9CHLR|nr:M20/M25/M40 family metallo-hydrolase [Reticulibacter mediterranei]GHO99361.1 dipeptidase [Reticulibacter mediterranei]
MSISSDLRQTVHQLMPTAIENLKQLVSIPSIATEGYPDEKVLEAAHTTEELLRAAGFQHVRLLSPDGGRPAIYGEIPGPPDTPTVLLYAHYDVQPSGPIEEWSTPPFEPAERDGRLYGRGAADDKSGIVAHLATIRAFKEGTGKLPVGIKIVIEGDEEFDSSLASYIPQHPDLFKADVVVIADHGSITVGEPTLTTSLRGSAALTVEVRTLRAKQHNGVFGGPVPDAFIALCKMIASLHDEHGRVQIPGLEPSEWQGADVPEEAFRRAASLLPTANLLGGERSLSAQLWAGYSLNVIAVDMPAIEGAANSLIDVARARINLRVPSDQDAERAVAILKEHLVNITPWNATLVITDSHTCSGFVAKTDGPGYRAARQALREAYNVEPQDIGDGASIPLTNVLSQQFPEAEILIWGAEDLAAGIHGPDESVDLKELERIVLAQALFLQQLAQR